MRQNESWDSVFKNKIVCCPVLSMEGRLCFKYHVKGFCYFDSHQWKWILIDRLLDKKDVIPQLETNDLTGIWMYPKILDYFKANIDGSSGNGEGQAWTCSLPLFHLSPVCSGIE